MNDTAPSNAGAGRPTRLPCAYRSIEARWLALTLGVAFVGACAQDRATRVEPGANEEEAVFERRGELLSMGPAARAERAEREAAARKERQAAVRTKQAEDFRDKAGLPNETVLSFADYDTFAVLFTDKTFVYRKAGADGREQWASRPLSELRSAERVRLEFDPQLSLLFSDGTRVGLPLHGSSGREWMGIAERVLGMPPGLRPLGPADYERYVVEPIARALASGNFRLAEYTFTSARKELAGRTDPADLALLEDLGQRERQYAESKTRALTQGGVSDGLRRARHWRPGWSKKKQKARLTELLAGSSEANTLLRALAPFRVDVEVDGSPRKPLGWDAEDRLHKEFDVHPAEPRTIVRVALISRGKISDPDGIAPVSAFVFGCTVELVRNGEVVAQRATEISPLGINPAMALGRKSRRWSPVGSAVHEAIAVYMLDELERFVPQGP